MFEQVLSTKKKHRNIIVGSGIVKENVHLNMVCGIMRQKLRFWSVKMLVHDDEAVHVFVYVMNLWKISQLMLTLLCVFRTRRKISHKLFNFYFALSARVATLVDNSEF